MTNKMTDGYYHTVDRQTMAAGGAGGGKEEETSDN